MTYPFSFFAEGEQTAENVLTRLTSFVSEAKRSLDFAVYDMRLDEPLKNELIGALAVGEGQDGQTRICYDGDKPLQPNLAGGQDPAPPGTGARLVVRLSVATHRGNEIHASEVHRSRSCRGWTGSLNITNNAFTLMENNVLEINSTALADYYARDFEELWEKQNFEGTGEIQTTPVPLTLLMNPPSCA